MADRDVVVDIIGRDKTAPSVRSAARNFDNLKKQTESATKAIEKSSKAAERFSKMMTTAIRTTARASAHMAALASTIGPVTVGLLAIGKAAAAAGKSLVTLAPLAAFLPSLAGAVGLFAGAFKLIKPAIADVFSIFNEIFVDAEGKITNVTERIRILAIKGVAPLVREFVRLNGEDIVFGLSRIAVATNKIVKGVLRWVNTAEGQRLLLTIITATVFSFERLQPKITAAAIALGRLANRAGDKAITGLADLIGRILDKFTAWANSTSAADIKRAISELAHIFDRLKAAFIVLRDIGKWMGENEGKVRALATALAVFGIVVGALSGTVIPILIGTFSLLVLNWERVKAAFSTAAKWWNQTWTAIKNDPAVREFVTAVREHMARMTTVIGPLIQRLRAELVPAFMQMKAVILRDVIPALTAFLKAISPIVAWFGSRFVPVIITSIGVVVRVITGGLKAIAGIFNVVTALINGDWRRLWQGIRQIVIGGTGAVQAIVRGAWNAVRSIFRGGVEATVAIVRTWQSRIVGIFSGAASWLAGVGRAIGQGLANGIRGAWGAVSAAVAGLVGRARELIPAPLRAAIGFAASGSWRPANIAADFSGLGSFSGADGGGRSRTGGPTPVTLTNNVMLDGTVFWSYTANLVMASERRQAWRAQVGRR